MSDKVVSTDVFGGSTNKSRGSDKREEDAIRNSEFTYDKKFKQLFQTKEFLTPILKNIIPEYKNCPLEQIETLITPRGDVTVNPTVYSCEDSGKGNEMPTHYDVLVDCALPDNEKVCVDLFFDLEMQRKNRPGYSVPKRGVYYCCRLINRQLDVLDQEEAYDQVTYSHH